MRPTRTAAWALVPLLVLAGCQTSDSEDPEAPGGSKSSSVAAPSDGTAAEPAEVEAGTDLLDWTPLPGSDGATVTSNGEWTVTVPDGGDSYTLTRLDDPGKATTIRSGGRPVTDALLNDSWAVIVDEDDAGRRPQRARVVDLDTGKKNVIDRRATFPTTTGGSWALDGDRLAYPTLRGRDYCLAYLDLATDESTLGPCVGAREGFNNVHLGAAGDSLLRFDLGGKRSCRTVSSISGDRLTAFPGVPKCAGAEGVLFGDGAVWSVVPRERRFEQVRVFARSGKAHYDLGAGSNGTLVACGDAIYFSRDAQSARGTADVLRWDGEHLDVVYRSKPGSAVLTAPRCGGDQLSVTSMAEGGDEQVTAPLS